MGKSIKSECVIQILSRSQKHEQVLKFPTHILLVQSGCVTAHKWFDAAWGPAAVGGENYLFIAPVAWPADWAVPFSPGRPGSQSPWTLGPGNPHFSCFVEAALSQHSSRQSVGWAASCCRPPTWPQTLIAGYRKKREQRKRKQSSLSFKGLAAPHCPFSIWTAVYVMNLPQCEPDRGQTGILWILNMRWKGHCIGRFEHT